MTPAIRTLALDLCNAILAEQGTEVIDLSVAKQKRRITVLAADLKAAVEAPLAITPWSFWGKGK